MIERKDANHDRRVAVLGAGGHARVVVATLLDAGYRIAGIYDDAPIRHGTEIFGYPVLGPLDQVRRGIAEAAVIAIGENSVRAAVAARFPELPWITLIHPRAAVHRTAEIGPGTVVLAGAIVQPEAHIGRHGIVNTGASVDHECRLGDYVHVAPGARLAGRVTVGDGVLMGLQSGALPGVEIGAWTNVGAGAIVLESLPNRSTAVGTPARVVRTRAA